MSPSDPHSVMSAGAPAPAGLGPSTSPPTKSPPPIDPHVAARRAALDTTAAKLDPAAVPPGAMGLALSGGGIRSATLSLGLVQAFARRDRLLDFDYLSTVSGGGYLGSFLTSLYLPENRRGSGTLPAAPPPDHERIRAFADKVLSTDARQELMDDDFSAQTPPPKLRNPIWWLREHSRYLAPNGPTDYSYSAFYIVRNWLALLYVVSLPIAAIFYLATGVFWWGLTRLDPSLLDKLRVAFGGQPAFAARFHGPSAELTLAAGHGPSSIFMISPIVLAALVPFLLGLSVVITYWLTVTLRIGNLWRGRRAGDEKWQLPPWMEMLLQIALLAGAIELLIAATLWLRPLTPEAALPPGASIARPWATPWPERLLWTGIDLTILALVIAAAAVIFGLFHSPGTFTSELRRRLTRLGSVLNQAMVICLAAALIDTLALAALGPGRSWFAAHHFSGVASAVLVPVGAFLINKLPQWLGGGRAARIVGDYIWTIALFVGAILYALLAVITDAILQAALWPDAPWAGPLPWERYCWVGGILVLLVLLTGCFTSFVNISSLHSLYAGRLTRAYLGASNLDRLRDAANSTSASITENHPKDYIDISTYQAEPTIAPVHLINTTLNETHSRERSQLVDRDRKGLPLVFAPGGISVDSARAADTGTSWWFGWDAVKGAGAESLAVGQLCAISGAAASAGMGARTTLGGALALSFANVRLGYWWWIGDLLRNAARVKPGRGNRLMIALTRPLRTYFYVFSEMTARYSRAYRRVYLSDGGHFENSGAYELLRRGTRLVVVADNGADPNFAFVDLENLARKARLDLGLALDVATPKQVRRIFGKDGAVLFLNGAPGDWRERAKPPASRAFAVLINVYRAVVEPTPGAPTHSLCQRIIWLKPQLVTEAPPDVIGYGRAHADFPQQTTGDQFFDEAQWESYRALGFTLGEMLLTMTKRKANALRRAIPPQA